MSKLKQTYRWIGLALLASALLVPNASYADSRPDLVIAVNKLPRSLEPAEKTGNVDVRVSYSVFDTLIRRDFINSEEGKLPLLKPHLAESWKRIDSNTLEVKLRKGVKFHNGDEVTADDVVFTFSPERIAGKEAVVRNGRTYFGHLKSVDKVDDYTVRISTKGADIMLEQRLATYAAWIVSKKQWTKYKEAGETWAAAQNAAMKKNKKAEKKKKKGPLTFSWMHHALKKVRWNPVGTGPLKFKEWRKSQYIVFTANDDYFMGKPAFKTLTFKVVPEVATRIAGLASGEYDIIVDVPPDQMKVLDRYKDIDVRSVVLENSHVIVFTPTTENLKDKRLRQALSLAIDREKLRNALWGGKNFTPNGHQLASFGDMYNSKRKGYVYDPEKAKKLVKESGYDGRVITYRSVPNYYLNGMEAAQILQQMWKKVGINVELKFVDNRSAVRAKGAEIFDWSNTYRLPDPTGALMISWGVRASVQRKYKFWKAPKAFNDRLAKILASGDSKERYEEFQKVFDIFEDEMPGTILYNPLMSYGIKKKIEWTPYPIFYMDFRPDVLKIKG